MSAESDAGVTARAANKPHYTTSEEIESGITTRRIARMGSESSISTFGPGLAWVGLFALSARRSTRLPN